jgi:hypothetical protein
VGSSSNAFDTGVVGSSSSLTDGGRNAFATGSGSFLSISSGNTFSNSDFGGANNRVYRKK